MVTSPGLVKAEINVNGVSAKRTSARRAGRYTKLRYDHRTVYRATVEYRKSGDKLIFTKRKDYYLYDIESSVSARAVVDVRITTDVTIPPSLRKGEHVERVLNSTITKNTEIVDEGTNHTKRLVGEDQPIEIIKKLIIIMNDYRNCVATNLYELSQAMNIVMDIKELPSSKPVAFKPYRTSNSEREEINRIIREWRDVGIVQNTESPYASPVILVCKKNGESRLVIDFRRLNQQTERAFFLTKLGQSFSTN